MKRNETKISVTNLTVEFFLLMKASISAEEFLDGLMSYLFSTWRQRANLIISL